MNRYAILANNGFNYDYVREIEAESVAKARAWFKDKYRGDWRVSDFRVRNLGPAAASHGQTEVER